MQTDLNRTDHQIRRLVRVGFVRVRQAGIGWVGYEKLCYFISCLFNDELPFRAYNNVFHPSVNRAGHPFSPLVRQTPRMVAAAGSLEYKVELFVQDQST